MIPEYVECPYCEKSFPYEFIHLHLVIHQGNDKVEETEKSIERKEHPLQCLLFNQKLISDLHLYFILELSENKLFPIICFQSEFNIHYSSRQYVWSSDVNLRDFDGYIPPVGVSSNPLSRKCHLTILTNIPSLDLPLTGTSQTSLDAREISTLKSMLQKAFRRGLVIEGSHISLQLLLNSPEEYLRRLPIILIEDGVFHWSYPVLIWLMIAHSKGYLAPFPLLLICLHIFIDGCLGKVKDIICDVPFEPPSSSSSSSSQSSSSSFVPPIQTSILDLQISPQRTMLTSLLLRAAYGGMKGDVKMIRHIASQWATRFSTQSTNFQGITQSYEHLYLHTNFVSQLHPFFHLSIPNLAPHTTPVPIQEINHYLHDTLPLLGSQSGYDALKNFTQSFLSRYFLFDVSSHLVSEGIDFHCDALFIPSLVRAINTSPNLSAAYQEWYRSKFEKDSQKKDDVLLDTQQGHLSSAVWYFRSAVNIRKTKDWNLSSNNPSNTQGLFKIFTEHELSVFERQQVKTLNEKAELAGLWKIICPLVNDYSQKKLSSLKEYLFVT